MLEVSNAANTINWPEDEASLVPDLRNGSEAAFDRLIERYQFEVHSLASYMLGDPRAAEEVSVAVFVKSLASFGRLPRGASPRIWLYRISIRELLACGQAQRTGRAATFPPKDTSTPPEERTDIRRALQRLAKPLRVALILRDFTGLSYEETAEVLNLPLRTVKSRVLEGRRALCELLDASVLADQP